MTEKSEWTEISDLARRTDAADVLDAVATLWQRPYGPMRPACLGTLAIWTFWTPLNGSTRPD
jgi:hypothetical protein